MKEVKVKLYHFDELSDDAKHKVCERDRNESYGGWASICQESDFYERKATLDKFCETFGIKYHIDLDHCHRFISWNFTDYDIDDEKICGRHLWRFLNKFYFDIRSRKYFSTRGYYDKNGKYHYKFRYSHIQWVEQNCPFTGMCYDCDILDKIFEWYKSPDWKLSLHDLFDECFDHYLKLWSEEDDYRMSDESISDMISANCPETLYYEDGTEFNGIYEEAA